MSIAIDLAQKIRCIAHVREVGGSRFWCNGRSSARRFYERHGLKAVGEEFLSPHTGPHYLFVLELNDAFERLEERNESMWPVKESAISESDAHQSETYKVEYTSDVTSFLAQRRAATHAAFFLPYLRAGMRVLDCGCGPGSITTDLAAIVHPAEVVGIDIEPDHITLAQQSVAQHSGINLRFELGDIRQLAFPDNSFDAVFIHGMVEYLADPIGAFKEVYRVLRPGGVLGTRHGDWGGLLLAPADPLIQRFFTLFQQFMQHTGGDPYFGRNQLAALHQADFSRIVVSASYDCWTATPQARQSVAAYLVNYCVSPTFADPLVQLHFADRELLEQISVALRAWGTNEGAFAAEAWGEAVAWKDG